MSGTVSEKDARFDGSIPEIYDRHLGPLLFEPYAADMAERVARRRPRNVLEVAAGTGIVSRRLLRALPKGTALTITDLNEPMLAQARQKTGPDARQAVWRQADAQELPFPDGSFDLVACQFGVMFFPDKPKGLREFRRVLEKSGALIFSVWDSLERNPVPNIAHSTIGRFFRTEPPEFYKVPFVLGDVGEVRQLVKDAGFKEIVIDTLQLTGRSESPHHAAVGLVKGNPVINTLREQGTADIDEIIGAVARAIEERFGTGPLEIPLRAHVVSAINP
jgi:ubiquinone/menaquinone biosynthesis C-methylase UbiE